MESFESRRLLSITINTAIDERDFNIVSGDVSLRDAILEAADGETINFSTNALHGLNGATIYLQESLKEIAFAKSLTIDASMLSNGVTIDGNNAPLESADKHRIFNISGGASTHVTLINLTFTGGVGGRNSGYVGGAIRSSASLTLENCSIFNNYSGMEGGGLYFAGGSGSALTLKSTHISGNSSVGKGGGLYVSASNATVRIIENSTVNGNTSDFTGGGMYVESDHTIFEMENSTISGNTGTGGGGGVVVFDNQGQISIENSAIIDNDALSNQGFAAGLHIRTENTQEVKLLNVVVTENEAVDGIGGVYIRNSNSDVTIADCTISENTGRSISSFEVGGGLHIHGRDSSTTTIQNSTISGNKLLLPSGPRTPGPFSDYMSGGGMNLEVDSGSTVVVSNSTISGNRSAGGGGGVLIGNYLDDGQVHFDHCTITENHANADDSGTESGGGIFFEIGSSTTVELDHTIVAKNYRGSGTTTYDDISNSASNPISAAWSLIGINTGAAITTVPGTTNKGGTSTFTDPLLGPLVNNGGSVFLDGSKLLTHALLPASPAINGGDPNFDADGPDGNPGTADDLRDQRGVPWNRKVGLRIDIGAFERQDNPLIGDYNFNGVVDAADYSVWRNTLGSTVDLRADGSGNGVVDQLDYEIWKAGFGDVIGDFDGSGATDIADYFLWSATEGSTTDLRADCNEDGIVDEADYQIWFDTYGSTLAVAQFGLLSSMFDPDAPPAVVGVTLGFSGVAAVDFAGKVGSGEQLRSVPLIAANTLSITFSQDVVVAQGHLSVTNLDGSSPTIFDFSYDALSQTATWTFNTSLADGRYLVRLSDSIESVGGKALDGEFFNPTKLSDTATAVFPSGDGDEGGEFRFRFTVLAGDTDHNNIHGAANYQNWKSTEPGLIIVSTTADDYDGDLSFGDVSLREAVHYANTAGSAAAIQLPAGRYVLSRSGTETTVDATVNDLDITGDVTIVGAGPGLSVIATSWTTAPSDQRRVFDVNGAAARLRLERGTVTGSVTVTNPLGAAALVQNEATLELVESAIVFNVGYGAGAAVRSIGSDVVVLRSVFTNNQGQDGVAIWASEQVGYDGSLEIGESIFALNVNWGGYMGGTTPNVKAGASVAKTNRGKNHFDNASGGFFDVATGSGDHLGTPQYVVTTVGDLFDHSDDVESLSLREAIDKANTTAGTQEIWMPAWRFTLTRDRGVNVTDTDVSYGDLDVKDSAVVRGVAGRTRIGWTPGVVDKAFDLIGDFNQDGHTDYGSVSAADYTIWQDQNGASGAWEQFSADADDDGDVDEDDYDLWVANFGHTLTLSGINS